MSDYDRGPYTPPSDRLAFDPREPVRSGGPAPVTLIVSGVILAAIIGGVVALYHGGLKHKPGPPATVGQPAPTADAGNAAAPPPAQLTIDRSDNALAAAPPAQLAATNSAPLAAVPGPPPAAPAAARPAAGPAPIRTAAVQAPAAPTTAPATPAKPPKPLTIASLADAAVRAPAPLRPALHAPAAPSPGAAPAGFWAQIGAFSTSALADKGWTEIAAFDHHDMAGKGKQVESTTHDGRTFYRTVVTGFSSEAAAQAFCKKLTDAHKPCITH
jgi:hypothetical protein